jgi:hypothetical protein
LAAAPMTLWYHGTCFGHLCGGERHAILDVAMRISHRDDGYLSSRVKGLYRKAPSGFRKASAVIRIRGGLIE